MRQRIGRKHGTPTRPTDRQNAFAKYHGPEAKTWPAEILRSGGRQLGGSGGDFISSSLPTGWCKNYAPICCLPWRLSFKLVRFRARRKRGGLATETLPNPTLAMSVCKSCLCSLKSATTDEGSERTSGTGTEWASGRVVKDHHPNIKYPLLFSLLNPAADCTALHKHSPHFKGGRG